MKFNAIIISTSALVLALIVSACGGGSSNSGGASAPPVGQTVFAKEGLYSGTRNYTLSSPGLPDLVESSEFSMVVSGAGIGQQAIIRFSEFSGSSSIDTNLNFSVPSGNLQPALIRRGQPCPGSTQFAGRFQGDQVTGTENGTFTCPGGQVVTINGTFQATLQLAGKFNASDKSIYPAMLDSK